MIAENDYFRGVLCMMKRNGAGLPHTAKVSPTIIFGKIENAVFLANPKIKPCDRSSLYYLQIQISQRRCQATSYQKACIAGGQIRQRELLCP
jgi:hypothetical protein